MNLGNRFLLTGAGFTANFSGFLARDMWSRIFSNPKMKDAGSIKFKMRTAFNFENVYSEALDPNSRTPQGQQNILKEVINNTYRHMDDVIQSSWDSHNIDHERMKKFLEYFDTFFTLNQDLLLEKRFHFQPLGPTAMHYAGQEDLDSYTPKTLPNQVDLDRFIGEQTSTTPHPCYIKLHGSLRWINHDGQDSMLIGVNKPELLQKVELLKWYHKLFTQDALYKGNTKLLIVGYGFRDGYINDVLYRAVKDHGLKIYLISTRDPENFHSDFTANNSKQKEVEIWQAIEGYFQYKLSDLFRKKDNPTSPELDEIYRSLES